MTSLPPSPDLLQPPPRFRWALRAALAGLVTGAIYIISQRGSALLVDLSAMASSLFCL